MADKNVNIKITAESKEAEKSLNSLTAQINKLGKSQTLKGITRLSTAVNQSLEIFGKLKDAVGDVISKINECAEAYAEQRSAELALQTAAQNNPYLDRTAVQNLQNYATQMSKLSGIADEKLLPAMTKLAAAGRTEAEVMKIVSTAVDVAASGTMSFESAVDALNKTYTGTMGSIGESIPAVRNLTKAQLEAGEAVDIIAETYKGMAESMTTVTGGSERLSNALKSIKEEMGAAFVGPINAAKTALAGFIENIADAMRASRMLREEADELKKLQAMDDAAKGTAEYLRETELMLSQVQKKIAELESSISTSFAWVVNDDERDAAIEKALSNNKELQSLIEEEKKLSKDLASWRETSAKEAEEAAEAAKRAAAAEEAAAKNASAEEMIAAYQQRIKAVQEEIRIRRELGEEINELAEMQEIAEAKFSGLVDLVTNSNGLITTDNKFFKSERDALAALYEEIEELTPQIELDTASAEDKLQALKDAIEAATPSSGEWRELSDTILDLTKQFDDLRDSLPADEAKALEKEIEELKKTLLAPELTVWDALKKESKDIYEYIEELQVLAKEASASKRYDLEKAYLEEIERLNEVAAKKSADAWDAYVDSMKVRFMKLVSQITSAISQVGSIISSTCDILLETAENNLSATLDNLEIAYLRGEINEEEYNAAVVKAKAEAAKEEYKIEMWQWGANLLTATANVAQGVTKAIAQGGVAGIVTGALVAAAGAVQIASIIASKPTPPTFSTGGIVGGSSYTGDRVQALLNSGEMVLNAGQQRNLFDSINSGNIGKGDASGQSNVTQVQVNNSAANIVSSQTEVSENQIMVMIDARVNSSMKKGRYNKALTQADQLQSGKWYGS